MDLGVGGVLPGEKACKGWGRRRAVGHGMSCGVLLMLIPRFKMYLSYLEFEPKRALEMPTSSRRGPSLHLERSSSESRPLLPNEALIPLRWHSDTRSCSKSLL